MSDPHDSTAEPAVRHEASGSYPGLPRWVKVSAFVVTGLALAALVIMLLAGGEHGPGRHASGKPEYDQSTHATLPDTEVLLAVAFLATGNAW